MIYALILDLNVYLDYVQEGVAHTGKYAVLHVKHTFWGEGRNNF